jgi:protein-L-isoaspartate(D-aspartate) O-methyltransferase
MWRNEETLEFIDWLRAHNRQHREREDRAGFHGLDLYSMFTSIAAVLTYLDDVDPTLALVARERYAELLPWRRDPAAYGRAVLVGQHSSAEDSAVRMLKDLLARRLDYSLADGDRFFDATENARVVKNAERYYRAMYHGSAEAWNLRDAHMFDTLESVLDFYGPAARAVVWEHNSHVGDATATEMSSRGELNVGQLCRVKFQAGAYLVGFGTDHGSVAAASSWGAEMREMRVRPAHADSYERLCHGVEQAAFMLHLREPRRAALRDELSVPRLERAIGVVYRPEMELASHYFHASLPLQFDEYVWLDETSAITPLAMNGKTSPGMPDTYPFGS